MEYSNEANFNEPRSFARNRGDVSNESLICQETARYINFFFSFSRIKSEFTGPLRGSRLLHCSELGNLNKLFEGGGATSARKRKRGARKRARWFILHEIIFLLERLILKGV